MSADYAGTVVVAVTLTLGLALAATGLGQRIVERVCAALRLSCAAAEDRAFTLGIPCVTHRSDVVNSSHLTFRYVRLGGRSPDEYTELGDGSASLFVGKGADLGVQSSSGTARGAGGRHGWGGVLDAHAVGYVEAGTLYDVPSEAGGWEAGRALVADRRGVVGQAVDWIAPAYTWDGLNEADHRARDAWDRVAAPWGGGRSAAERAAAEQAYELRKADATVLTLGSTAVAQGGLEAGAVEAGVVASADERATVVVAEEGSDRPASVFSTRLSAELTGSLTTPSEVGGVTLPTALSAEVGRTVSKSLDVEFDASGQPTELVVTTTFESAGQAGVRTAGSTLEADGPGASAARADVISQTLDLTDPADRAAFDGAFATVSGELRGRTFGVATQKVLSPEAVAALDQRLGARGYLAWSHYDVDDSATDPSGHGRSGDVAWQAEAKGVGGGFSLEGSTRTLVSARVFDPTRDGAFHDLPTCAR